MKRSLTSLIFTPVVFYVTYFSGVSAIYRKGKRRINHGFYSHDNRNDVDVSLKMESVAASPWECLLLFALTAFMIYYVKRSGKTTPDLPWTTEWSLFLFFYECWLSRKDLDSLFRFFLDSLQILEIFILFYRVEWSSMDNSLLISWLSPRSL